MTATVKDMTPLNVPYRQQISETACGVAAFEMVFRYFRPSKLSKFSQEKPYAKLEEPTPEDTSVRVSTDALVALAQTRGFQSGWGRVNPLPTRLIEQIRYFIEMEKIPLIACQQWHGDRSLGHFRVIIGIENAEIVFHDPEKQYGGQALHLPLPEFIESWRPTSGGNVTGGVAIWISDREIISPLDPGHPSLWNV